MIASKVIPIVILCIAVTFTAAAQKQLRTSRGVSPQALVADLYRQHKKKSPFFQNKSRALVDKYFDKALADLIWNIPNSPDEVGPLDGDPLYNAQDVEIKNFVIHNPTIKNVTANLLVTFTNFGKKQEIKFLLASRPNGWKITNIKYDDGTDLIGILTQ